MIFKIEKKIHSAYRCSNGTAVVKYKKMSAKIGWNNTWIHGFIEPPGFHRTPSNIGSYYAPNTNIMLDWNENSICFMA